jgi:hypothetical protein
MAVKTRWRGRAKWRRWAQGWLSGSDRSHTTAIHAAWAAYAVWAAGPTTLVGWAARSATYAAWAAAPVARTDVPLAALADAAYDAALAAATATHATAIDLIAIAHEAVSVPDTEKEET